MPIPMRAACAVAIAASAGLVVRPAVAGETQHRSGPPLATFTPLGDLTGGLDFSAAFGVSADGTTVVGLSNATNGAKAFRWNAGMMADLSDLSGGAVSSRANAASANGGVVVGQGTSGSGPEAFLYDGDLLGLGDFDMGSFSSSANGVSADGSVVVGAGSSANGTEAFRWEGGSLLPLGDLSGGSFASEAADVSADGLIIAGTGNSDNGTEAFVWENSVFSPLGDLDGGNFFSAATAISSDGSTVVGRSATSSAFLRGGSVFEAFRWQNGNMIGLGELAGGDEFSEALDVSADGSVIVGKSAVGSLMDGETAAFIWGLGGTPTMRNLRALLSGLGVDMTDWTLLEATGVSDDGMTVVGTGINPAGDMEAFIATVPEPGTMLLMAGGALVLLRRRRPL